MSGAESTSTLDRGGSGDGDPTSGTTAAVENFVGPNVMKARYLLAALGLAVVWWQTVGPMSAWVAGIGLVVLSFATPHVVATLASRRWPTVEGVVVESEVLTEWEAREQVGIAAGGASDDAGYVPLVRYQFTVDGTRYESAGMSPFDGTLSRRRWATALVDRYPRNRHVTLRYDPDDPTRAYLRPWLRSKYALFLGIGAILLAVAGFFYVTVGTSVPA